MRAYVSEAAGGRDVLDLHEEKPMDQMGQQALALASQLVTQDAQQTLGAFMKPIQELAQKVQQAQQSQQQSAAMGDPTAAAIVKTQMAETERKTQEFQSRMQSELQQSQQNYQLKVAELQQKVAELQTKYSTQTNIDNQRNATDIAMANINNAAKERVAMITKGAEIDQQQMQLEHEQNLSAIDAIQASDADIRQHGLAIQQQAFQTQADQVKKAADSQQQAALAQQQHEQQVQQQSMQAQNQAIQGSLDHQQTLEQQAAAQPTPTPPTGAI
jgi:hypothetical protein